MGESQEAIVDGDAPDLKVISGTFGKPAARPAGGEIVSPAPPPGANLSTQERRVWEYICEQLQLSGVEHRTAGITIVIIVRAWLKVVESLKDMAEKGEDLISEAGNPYMAPWTQRYYQNLKVLEKWLPQACLTIPSLAKVKEGQGGPKTGDLFEDVLGFASAHPG